MFWPDADTGQLRSIGQAWTTAADSVQGWVSVVDSAKLDIQLEKSPEIPDAVAALTELSRHTADLSAAYRQIGQACADYARHVDDHHTMIEDELESFVKWTILIETAGGIVGFFTLGIGEGAAQAAEAAEVATAASRVVRILRALLVLARTVAATIGSILTKAVEIVNGLRKFRNAKAIAALERVGISVAKARAMERPAAEAAFEGMNKGGGHAIRHLIDEGLVANKGSLASKVEAFKNLTQGILESPAKTFDWTVGGTACRGFAGVVDGKTVVVFVAEEGPYAGKVLSSVVPKTDQVARWRL